MTTFLSIFIVAVLSENYVLSKFLGICSFLGVSKKLDTALGMSYAVIFVSYWQLRLLIDSHVYPCAKRLAYLQTLLFILVIAALVQLVEIVLKKYIPGFTRLSEYTCR
jgi:electron transport complex protein RnfA